MSISIKHNVCYYHTCGLEDNSLVDLVEIGTLQFSDGMVTLRFLLSGVGNSTGSFPFAKSREVISVIFALSL